MTAADCLKSIIVGIWQENVLNVDYMTMIVSEPTYPIAFAPSPAAFKLLKRE